VAIGYRSSGVRRFGALFPFGHGRGFAPTRHEVVGADVVEGDVRVVVRATNLGDRATVHVAQAYLELDGFDDGAALVGLARRAVVESPHLLRIAVHALDAGLSFTVQVDGQPVSVPPTRSG
jgi:hypothetical protein